VKSLLVSGARPNFVKVAPILKELEARGHESILVHTGQHYSTQMSEAFFRDLDIREPDHDLDVGSGTHAQQTARVMERFEPVLEKVRPDWVVVVGDVNSTLACALVTAKLRARLGCRLAHVEAGLRSRNWSMPEEVNRVLTDRLSDLCFTPSPPAKENLLHEGIPQERIRFVGNVMIDTLLSMLPAAERLDIPRSLKLETGEYVVLTLHRPANVDDPEVFRSVLTAMAGISDVMPVIFPVHPRTEQRARDFELHEAMRRLITMRPVGYPQMIGLMRGAAVVFTDSGGIQEETTVLGIPGLTLRPETGRPVTVEQGTNRMVKWPPTAASIEQGFHEALRRGIGAVGDHVPEGWDGAASSRIVDALEAHIVPSIDSSIPAHRVSGVRIGAADSVHE
jgi:UDP-N-acetylglucosamine 2-epimerase (non-hydrolysing)